MRIFLDTAHFPSIQACAATGLIDGITTNPSHLSKEQEESLALIKKICTLLPKACISVQVTESDPKAVYEQAHRIAKIAENVIVKIPCYPAYFPIIERLASEHVPLNITLVFTAFQGICMAKLKVQYVSLIIGRLDDIDQDGIQQIADLRQLLNTDAHNSTGIIAASLRTVGQAHQAAIAGADVLTLPVGIFDQMIRHPLVEKGIEIFSRDWQERNIKSLF